MHVRFFTITLLVLALTSCASSDDTAAPVAGSPAPPLALPTLNGETVRLDDLQGNVVLVNFWASWCEPCTREMPRFQQWHVQYGDDGLVVLGVDTLYQDQRAAVEEFLRERQITYPIVLDEDHATSRQWMIQQLPRSYVIDREGMVRALHIGEFREQDFEQHVLPLLQQ
jgi:peroxiredoxin